MQMPQPAAEHARLRRLEGTWKGTETMHPMAWAPQGGTADGIMEARMTCHGLFLVIDYRQLKGADASFAGHGVYGWDAAESCYTMHWFDSMTPGGFCKPVRGRWEGDTLTFAHAAPQHVRYVYRLHSADDLEFRIESSQDGDAWQCFMEARYRRA
jgi:hypothetical protein